LGDLGALDKVAVEVELLDQNSRMLLLDVSGDFLEILVCFSILGIVHQGPILMDIATWRVMVVLCLRT
jgi:hypothetical protein